MARYITLRGMTSPLALAPTNYSIVAGCSFATGFVKAAYVTELRQMHDVWRSRPLAAVTLDVFIDDMALQSTGPRHEVADALSEAGIQLARLIPEQLACEVAWHKAGVVSNDRELATIVAQRLAEEERAAR